MHLVSFIKRQEEAEFYLWLEQRLETEIQKKMKHVGENDKTRIYIKYKLI